MKIKKISRKIAYLAAIALVLIILRCFVFSPITAIGKSMKPTLSDGQKMIGLKNSNYERFDIITFHAPDDPDAAYVKRVIGLPGDSIRYTNDTLYVNGVEQPEPYLAEHKAQLTEGERLSRNFSLERLFNIDKIPEGKIFVLGDNRRNSNDSRNFGLVDEKEVISTMKISLWPLDKIGFVE